MSGEAFRVRCGRVTYKTAPHLAVLPDRRKDNHNSVMAALASTFEDEIPSDFYAVGAAVVIWDRDMCAVADVVLTDATPFGHVHAAAFAEATLREWWVANRARLTR